MNSNIINKIVTGTSGILNTANQIIPLYEEIKPLIKNIIKFKNKLKDLNLNNIFKNISVNSQNKDIEKIKKEEKVSFSSIPQFFQ